MNDATRIHQANESFVQSFHSPLVHFQTFINQNGQLTYCELANAKVVLEVPKAAPDEGKR